MLYSYVNWSSILLVVLLRREMLSVNLMDIMRSGILVAIMKDKVEKVKRPRINWIRVLHKLDRPALNDYFFNRLSVLHRGRSLSANRIAYNTLKHFYSTTTIEELVRKLDL